MRLSVRSLSSAAVVVALLSPAAASPALAQRVAARKPLKPQASADQPGRFRALAPGVETTIPPDNDVAATFSRHDMIEVLAADPTFSERANAPGFAMAKNVVFQHNVWSLEFTFKPIRMIHVDLPSKEGHFDRKLIWYMVYRVRNTGKQTHRSTNPDGTVKAELVDVAEPVPFVPEFRLASWDTGKIYPDRIIPLAIPEIEAREDASRRLRNVKQLIPEGPTRLLNTIEMERDIPPSPAGQELDVWGLATWEDIDPKTDHFSIYIRGLTNAYQWVDAKQGDGYAYKKGDKLGTGRKLLQRTLQLNFWRPSDPFHEHEEEIRFGYYKHPEIERFGLSKEEQVDYRWIFR